MQYVSCPAAIEAAMKAASNVLVLSHMGALQLPSALPVRCPALSEVLMPPCEAEL